MLTYLGSVPFLGFSSLRDFLGPREKTQDPGPGGATLAQGWDEIARPGGGRQGARVHCSVHYIPAGAALFGRPEPQVSSGPGVVFFLGILINPGGSYEDSHATPQHPPTTPAHPHTHPYMVQAWSTTHPPTLTPQSTQHPLKLPDAINTEPGAPRNGPSPATGPPSFLVCTCKFFFSSVPLPAKDQVALDQPAFGSSRS